MFKLKLTFFLTISLTSLSLVSSVGSFYSMKDLEVLEKKEDYTEFLKHAKDIPPSKRNNQWVEMVQGMAEGLVSDCEKHGRINSRWFNYIESLLLWPSLKTDLVFLNKRSSYGTKFIELCFKKKDNSECSDQLLQFWQRTPNRDPYLAISLVKITKRYKQTLDLWPMFSVAALSEASSFFCKRNDIQEALLYKLMSEIEQKSKGAMLSNQEIQLVIYSMMNDECWTEFAKNLKSALYTKSSIIRDIIFTLLNGHNVLTNSELDTFYTYFILSGPTAGPIFNLAWNRVKLLGSNFTRRQNVLKKIKTMDPLPGTTFNTFDLKKRKVLLGFLHENLPEYLDHYGRTCVSYLSGTKKFPNGNPTIECRDFFKDLLGTNMISNKIQQSYNKIP